MLLDWLHPLFCLLLTIRFLKAFFPAIHFAFHTILGIGLFVLIPWLLNIPIDNKVSNLHSQDNAETASLQFPRSLALIQHTLGHGKKKTNCEELCLRLLLNGSVDSFFTKRLDSKSFKITPGTPVIRYWIETRETCPGMDLPNERGLRTRFENESKGSYPADVMRQRMADGHCLLSEPAKVSDASMVIFLREIPGEKSEGIQEISRISAYQSSENHLEEVYRSTQVIANRHDPILLIGKFKSNASTANIEFIGTYRKRTGKASLDTLLAKTDVNLSIASVQKPDLSKNLRAVLRDQTAKPDDARFLAAETYLQQIAAGKSASPDNAELVRFLIYDLRYTATKNLSKAIPFLAQAARDEGKSLAKALFWRLNTQDPNAPMVAENYSNSYYLLGSLSKSIRALPTAALQDSLQALIQLSRNREKREVAANALFQLSSFGEPGVQAVLWLLDDNSRDTKTYRERRLEIITTSLSGLCYAGQSAQFAVAQLLELIRKGKLGKKKMLENFVGPSKLIIATLESMGASKEEIWDLFSSPNTDRERFEREFKPANCRW